MMTSKRMFLLIAGIGLSVAAFSQTSLRMAPVPSDPLEVVTSQPQTADLAASRNTALLLLAQARDSYDLRLEGRGYDLSTTFIVDSGGQTEYDGSWKMEDVFDPKQGLRWTATASSGYTVTRIVSSKASYGEGTANTIPLRLHEARAALFSPLPLAENLKRESIRTAPATFNGAALTCILISQHGSAVPTSGRSWDETEECIDPQSGLLRVSSQAPGRYYAYEYSNGLRLGHRMLPRKVTVTEGGKTVSTISVDSVKELPSADPKLFAPTPEMKANGAMVALGGAQKITRVAGPGPFTAEMIPRSVCVFGVITPSGQLVEAHSLQPFDPNSVAAVEDAKRINFAPQSAVGAKPQQHFVFVIERFY